MTYTLEIFTSRNTSIERPLTEETFSMAEARSLFLSSSLPFPVVLKDGRRFSKFDGGKKIAWN